MCEVASKPAQFRLNLDEKAKTNDNFIRAPTVEFPIDNFGEHQAKKIGAAEYSKRSLGITINDLISKRSNYISMLKPPEISGSFNEKLHISSDIKETQEVNIHFNYILNSILNILDRSLNEIKNAYHVNVSYKIYNDIPEWKRALIYVCLEDADFDATVEIWKQVGNKVEDFFNTLKKKPGNIWASNTVDQLSDLISIEFDSGE